MKNRQEQEGFYHDILDYLIDGNVSKAKNIILDLDIEDIDDWFSVEKLEDYIERIDDRDEYELAKDSLKSLYRMI